MKVIRSDEAKALNRHKESRSYYQLDGIELCLVHSTISDVVEPDFHAHPFPEIVICLEGSISVQTLFATPLTPGDLVYFEAGEHHRSLRPSPGAKLIAIKLGPPPRE
ncbi:MAG: cupin domain-containing protein [Thermoplasmata archaeon]